MWYQHMMTLRASLFDFYEEAKVSGEYFEYPDDVAARRSWACDQGNYQLLQNCRLRRCGSCVGHGIWLPMQPRCFVPGCWGFLLDLLNPYDESSAVYCDVGVAAAPDAVVEDKALTGLGAGERLAAGLHEFGVGRPDVNSLTHADERLVDGHGREGNKCCRECWCDGCLPENVHDLLPVCLLLPETQQYPCPALPIYCFRLR